MNTLWNDLAARAQHPLTAEQHDQLARYLDLLLAANQKMNLTRIDNLEDAAIHHVGDALTLLPHLPDAPHTLADVGSGGGVPGLVLAIARPDAAVTLVESTKKKAAFLREAAAALSLANLTVIDERAETVGRSEQRRSFDIVTARAVGALVWLAEWCLPLTKKGGKFLAMKGARIAEELPAAENALELLGGGKAIVHKIELPGTEHHVIVEIRKIAATDPRWPRDPTTTRGRPMG